jgi:hypothetical protein
MNLTAKVLEDLSVLPKLPVGIICHPSVLSKIRFRFLQERELNLPTIVSSLSVVVDHSAAPDQVEVFYDREKWEERIKEIENRLDRGEDDE